MSGLAEQWSTQLAGRDLPGDGLNWVAQLRREATDAFSRHGLPHRKVEDWKYTSLKLLEARAQQLAADNFESDPETIDWSAPLIDGLPAVFRMLNGRPVERARTGDGFSVESLRRALKSDEAVLWIEDRLGALELEGPARAFSALNTSMLGQGLVIDIGPGVDAGALLIQWAFDPEAPAALFHSRVLIRVQEGASLRLIEQFESPAPHAHGLNLVCQVELAADARLDVVRVQREADEAALITRLECDLGDGAKLTTADFDWGGGLVRHDTVVRLNGQGARTEVNGAFILDGAQHLDHHVFTDHVAGGTQSAQFFRGVLGGHSRGVYNGKARIGKGADGASVRQNNANLILSPMAEMDTKPELEIYADEVEASHGATVGQLDEDAVFYLRSRGLSDADARGMLTGAFCRTVIGRIADGDASLLDRIGIEMDAALAELIATRSDEGAES